MKANLQSPTRRHLLSNPKKSRLLLKILLEINRDDFDEQISLVSHDLVAICVSCVRCGLFVVLVLVVDREGELVTYRTPGPAPWSAPGPALAARPGPAHHSHSVISCRSWPSTEKLIVRLRYALKKIPGLFGNFLNLNANICKESFNIVKHKMFVKAFTGVHNLDGNQRRGQTAPQAVTWLRDVSLIPVTRRRRPDVTSCDMSTLHRAAASTN